MITVLNNNNDYNNNNFKGYDLNVTLLCIAFYCNLTNKLLLSLNSIFSTA